MGCRVRILARGMWVDNNRLLEELHGAATAAVAKVRALMLGQITIWVFSTRAARRRLCCHRKGGDTWQHVRFQDFSCEEQNLPWPM